MRVTAGPAELVERKDIRSKELSPQAASRLDFGPWGENTSAFLAPPPLSIAGSQYNYAFLSACVCVCLRVRAFEGEREFEFDMTGCVCCPATGRAMLG